MKPVSSLISAIRGKHFGQAQDIFSGIMQEKVNAALTNERKSLTEDNTQKCVHCGSKNDLEVVDGHAICAECDPER